MPKFSVITPITYDKDSPDNVRMPRYEMFLRCAGSMQSQTFRDFEWIVADDMCNPPVERGMFPAEIPDVRIIRLPEKAGRLYARNAGFKEAKGEWFCWLDGDDEYASWYLQAMDEAIKLHPDFKVFNFNHLIFHYDYNTSIRQFINMEIQGDTPFRSGTIGAGAFIYHRSVYEEMGGFPEKGLWDFAAHALEEFPELKPFYWNEQKQAYDSLGNPWGEDFYYFYKITRKHKSKYLNAAPYFVHSRWGHRWPDDPNYVVDPGKLPNFDPKNR
jgi:glycosyltransferase involved in cell wall biosynthesis